MKEFQKDHTIPEQSKRLLELGVPADSANCCYYVKDKCAPVEIIPPGNRDTPHTFSTYANGYNDVFYPENPSLFEWDNVDVLPCWSALRLMEIIDICALGGNSDPNTEEYPSTIKVMNKLHIPYVEYLVKSMERAVQLGTIDFSKLEIQ